MKIYKLQIKADVVSFKFVYKIVIHNSMKKVSELYPTYAVAEIGVYTGENKEPFELCSYGK